MTAANLPKEARALLDAIAVGESEGMARQEGISPYVILVGGGSMEGFPDRSGYDGFPDWPGRKFSTGISHAAGRYQFQPATWRGIVRKFSPSVPNFRNHGDQDWGAWFLAQMDYASRTGESLIHALQADDLGDIGDTLHPTWTSLGNRTFPARYHAALIALDPPAPPPTPPAPTPPIPATIGDIIVTLESVIAALKAHDWTSA